MYFLNLRVKGLTPVRLPIRGLLFIPFEEQIARVRSQKNRRSEGKIKLHYPLKCV